MKRLLLSLLLFLPTISFAQSKEIKFSLSCEILDQVVLGIEDGIDERYVGTKDQKQIGEVFTISFDYYSNPRRTSYLIRMNHELSLGWSYLDILISKDSTRRTYRTHLTGQRHERSVSLHGDKSFIYFGQEVVEGHLDIISSNYIQMEHTFAELKLQRYYKNDWQLTYNTGFGFNGWGTYAITVANCMNMPEEYNEMLEQIEKWHLANDK